MTVSLAQWLALMVIFNCKISGRSTTNRCNLKILALLLRHADIEPNPNPEKLKKNHFLTTIGILIP